MEIAFRDLRKALRCLERFKPEWAEASISQDGIAVQAMADDTELVCYLPAWSGGPAPRVPAALLAIKTKPPAHKAVVDADGAAALLGARYDRPRTSGPRWDTALPALLEGEARAGALARAVMAARQRADRPMLSGVCIEPDGTLVASDGYRLSVEQTALRPSAQVLLPARAVRLLTSAVQANAVVSLSVRAAAVPVDPALVALYGGISEMAAHGWAELCCGAVTVRARLVPFPCFPYRQLLRGFPGTTVRISAKEALAFARRLRPGQPLQVRANGTVELSLFGKEEPSVVVPGATEDGKDVEVVFGAGFFADAVAHAGTQWVRLELDPRPSYAKRPAAFVGTEGRRMVLMPLLAGTS